MVDSVEAVPESSAMLFWNNSTHSSYEGGIRSLRSMDAGKNGFGFLDVTTQLEGRAHMAAISPTSGAGLVMRPTTDGRYGNLPRLHPATFVVDAAAYSRVR